MYIMTATGWKQLSPVCVNEVWETATYDAIEKKYVRDRDGHLRKMGVRSGLPTPAEERGSYTGELPSQQACDYVNSLHELMKFFDDGVRMVYGKPDKIVAVDNAIPDHPIPYPPKGF